MRVRRWISLFGLLAIASGISWASPGAGVIDQMFTCSEIEQGAARLKCYDGAITQARAASDAPMQHPSAPEATVGDRSGSGGILQWFGFEAPVTKPEEFGKPTPPPASNTEILVISSKVLRQTKNQFGRSTFELENGQVWRQLDGDTTEAPDPTAGKLLTARIEKGTLGGYNLTLGDQGSLIKVRRTK